MTQFTVDQAMRLAVQHHRAGRLAQAEEIYRHVLNQQPNYADALQLLGVINRQLGRLDTGIELIRRAITINPAVADYYNNLGIALRDQRLLDESIAAFRHAIELVPNYAEAYSNLGNVLREKGLLDESIAAFRQAIRLMPGIAEAHHNLGIALRDKGLFDESAAASRETLRLKPDFGEAYNSLGGALRNLGLIEESIAAFRQAIQLMPNHASAHSNLLFAMHYHPPHDLRAIVAEHRAWSSRHADALSSQFRPRVNDRFPVRRDRLSIGYVSGDFRHHSVAHFLMPLLERHDPANFKIFGYSNVQRPDKFTERMKCSCHAWRDISALSDQEVATLVCADGVDVLVDLSGHTSGNRLLVFARRPAPVQVTYLGYPDTTGMSAIDYRLTDALADPPGMTDSLNVERLWRLATCAWCYHAPEEAPEIRARQGGPITFGCFNALPKVSPAIVNIWADLLHRVPESRLLLKSAGAGEASSRQRLRDQFARHGIAGDRLEIRGTIKEPRQHLEAYSQVDVALDTYPYHGTTTTCEALWMSVPVVSLAGSAHVSRVGVSLLTNVGMAELIAGDPEAYVGIAAELAGNPARLNHLRSTLRQQMEASPLMDAPRFARDIESAYRRMWEIWRSQPV